MTLRDTTRACVCKTIGLYAEIWRRKKRTRSASYLDLQLEIHSKVPLRAKLFDKRDHFNYPIAIYNLYVHSRIFAGFVLLQHLFSV